MSRRKQPRISYKAPKKILSAKGSDRLTAQAIKLEYRKSSGGRLGGSHPLKKA